MMVGEITRLRRARNQISGSTRAIHANGATGVSSREVTRACLSRPTGERKQNASPRL
ncbi:hypothetical protein EMCG_04824 [[Emmonsia] crescens]|uniref:Uncharacterized protein n=1 Tax=[Emmonsia] crescens TaxID=73230 RepID=A0A0G2HS63_9EURO|nr:hypothetical protein EMCG_04824 [Emmonsia crescens UAMH 3008]